MTTFRQVAPLKIIKYCYVFTFLKTFEYKFVDCKESKKKICISFRLKLMSHCSNSYHVFYNNYNNSYRYLICLQPFCKQHLFVILLTQLFANVLTTDIFKLWLLSLHKAHWITTDSWMLCPALLCAHVLKVERSGFCSREYLLRLPCCLCSTCYNRILVYSSWISMDLLVCTHCLLLRYRYLSPSQ